MIGFGSTSRSFSAAIIVAFCSLRPAAALEPAGVVPEAFFAEGEPSVAVETVNDSSATCINRVETDDIRSFGLRAYGSWRGFAAAIACDGFTFRSDAPETAMRSDELSFSAAWMGPPLAGGFLSVRPGAGAGLRAWGDFGFKALQEVWHDVLGVNRPFPTTFTEPSLRPFAYASADAAFFPESAIRGEVSVRELVLGSGGIESSIALLAAWRDGRSTSWAGVSRQDRLGSFDAGDSLASAYEEGTWAVAGARSGFLSVESAMNLDTNFAIGSIAFRFGGRAAERPRSGPRQELAIGTSFMRSELSTARLVVLPTSVEVHAGIEAVTGVSRSLWDGAYFEGVPYKGYPHFQEGSAVVEVFAFDPGGDGPRMRPFAGAALGARQDSLSICDLQRSELVDRTTGFLGKAYAGVRVCDLLVSREYGDRIAADLGVGFSVVGRPYPPPEVLVFLRLVVSE